MSIHTRPRRDDDDNLAVAKASRQGHGGFASMIPSILHDAAEASPVLELGAEHSDGRGITDGKDADAKDTETRDDDGKVAAFLLRNGLRPSAVTAAHEFARAMFPGCEVERAPFQGYCSYTLLLRPLPGGATGRRRDSGVEAGGGGSVGSQSQSESGTSWKSGGSSGGGGRLVQFRPRRHGIDVEMCGEARGVLGDGVVPGVEELGVLEGLDTATTTRGGKGKKDGELCAYLLERVGGVSLTGFRGICAGLETDPRASRRRLVADLAVVFADSWRGRREGSGGGGHGNTGVRGRVGGSLAWRLEIMEKGLPCEFRDVVRDVRRDLRGIEGLPWVVTHGDLVPDNIMVHPPREEAEDEGGEAWVRRKLGWGREERAGGLVGLIDWAEAEWLPFGVGMYGLEEVLGEDVVVGGSSDVDFVGGGSAATTTATITTTTMTTTTRFEYYPEAASLRALFWDEVGRVVGDEEVIRRAKRAQVLGVLLWRGIAFDDGALGRVVDGERDAWDLQRLRAWAFEDGGLGLTRDGC
ncbi:Protein kinase-like domain protein [Colletotrichum scovillei]|uniref:Protein kinase-like domain protein n=1 Tax=Colletotrichum scovillei TaxID=1209932 RepID=A0A9P7UCV6_9PEZI|nr:Protein kinase-like domain protein [Colletotrichum scovillei]KAG7070416.1 Protein kinase-like domain protein [Colletotrichum scovillei]KAG7078629.1 Protein kinase-like domain protein [Colletotrichum scovillei]